MFCVLTHRKFRRYSLRGIGNATAHAMIVLLLCSAAQNVSAQAEEDFEKPPVLNATNLIEAKLLQGKGFRVAEKVPTDGVMGAYTLIADKKTFGADSGTYQVLSREMVELRLSEIPAIIKLNETSKIGTFAKSMATTAVQPLESVGRMALHPVDTVTGLPNGVGRMFDRVGSGVGRMWNAEPTPGSGGEEGGTIDAARDLLGYDQVRRDLAKKLSVDPYTTNRILAKKLDEIATTAFRAHVGVNTAISVFVPASIILSGVQTIDNLVWDTPRGDLIVRVEEKLQELKVSPAQRAAFLHNPALPLSLQVAIVENLGRFGEVPGRSDVVEHAGAVATESQARFLATSIRMLAEYHEKKRPITAMTVPGPIVARDQAKALIMPAPVDYVSWTTRVASFAKYSSFQAAPQRTLLLAGMMSPRAKKEFEANGWTIQEGKEP